MNTWLKVSFFSCQMFLFFSAKLFIFSDCHLLPPFFSYFCIYFSVSVLLPTVPASRRFSFVATATCSRWRVSRRDWAQNVVWSQHTHRRWSTYIYTLRTDWDMGSIHSVQHLHPTQMLVDVHSAHCTHSRSALWYNKTCVTATQETISPLCDRDVINLGGG